MTHTPHDALVKRMLQDPKDAAPLRRAALPAAIVTRCDGSTLKLVDRSFIDERFREVHSDLLYEIQVGRHRALIYVLLEHKSECDPRTLVQMFVYVGRILDRYAEVTDGGQLRVPLVLPLILHHSESGWTLTTDLTQPSSCTGVGGHLGPTPRRLALRAVFEVCQKDEMSVRVR